MKDYLQFEDGMGGKVDVKFKILENEYNLLEIVLVGRDYSGAFGSEYLPVTIDLDASAYCAEDCAYVLGGIAGWLEFNKIASFTGNYGYFAYKHYPEMQFDMDRLKKYSI